MLVIDWVLMKKINANRYLILAVICLIVTSLFVGCSSDKKDVDIPEAENAEDVEIKRTDYKPKTVGNLDYWVDSYWGMQNYENQTVFQIKGGSEIQVTINPGSKRTPRKEAKKRIKKVKKEFEEGGTFKLVESKEWSNGNVSGWIFRMAKFNEDTNRENDYTEVIIASEGICRFSFINYHDDAITDEEFEYLLDGIIESE